MIKIITVYEEELKRFLKNEVEEDFYKNPSKYIIKISSKITIQGKSKIIDLESKYFADLYKINNIYINPKAFDSLFNDFVFKVFKEKEFIDNYIDYTYSNKFNSDHYILYYKNIIYRIGTSYVKIIPDKCIKCHNKSLCFNKE